MVCGKLQAWWLTQLWLITLLPSLIARWWVGPQTKCLLRSQPVSDRWRLTTNVCARAYRGPFVVVLCSGFSSPLSALLYFITVFVIICVSLWCFTDKVEDPVCGLNICLQPLFEKVGLYWICHVPPLFRDSVIPSFRNSVISWFHDCKICLIFYGSTSMKLILYLISEVGKW